jgi:glycosyltransferase involved in cell wall biosynthesis
VQLVPPDRPKVLVFVNYYPSPERPSQGAFVREYARAAALYADVAVLCNDGGTRDHPPGHALADGVQDGLRTIRLSYRRPPGPLPHAHYRLGIRAALRRLAADGFRPDIVHGHYYLAGGTAVRIGRRRGVPVVISEHSSTFPAANVTGLHRWRAKRTLERASLVCPVSSHLEEHIRATGIHPRSRVVANAVDTDVFRPPIERPARRGDPIRLAFVAVIRAGKGLHELLRALAGIDERRWRLDIAGDGPARGETERLAAELGLSKRVNFKGALTKPDVAALLQQSDLFVLPSHAETQGVVLLEAMACGLPVLATKVGGVPEIVDDRSGILVPPGDEEALSGALRRMFDEFERYDGRAIAEHAHSRFGYPAIGRRLSDIYLALIADREPPP